MKNKNTENYYLEVNQIVKRTRKKEFSISCDIKMRELVKKMAACENVSIKALVTALIIRYHVEKHKDCCKEGQGSL